jgi:hypothetical protein
MIWELLITGQDILVFASSPSQCTEVSDFIIVLVLYRQLLMRYHYSVVLDCYGVGFSFVSYAFPRVNKTLYGYQ